MKEEKVVKTINVVKVVGKPFAKLVIERIEKLVKDSDNKIDDLVVLPVCKLARFFFGI